MIILFERYKKQLTCSMKQNNFWKISFFAKPINSNERNWMWKTDWTVNIVFIWKIDFETIKTLESSTDRKFLNFSSPKNFNQLLVKQAVVWSLFLTPIAMVIDLHSFSFSKVSLVAKFKSNGSTYSRSSYGAFEFSRK